MFDIFSQLSVLKSFIKISSLFFIPFVILNAQAENIDLVTEAPIQTEKPPEQTIEEKYLLIIEKAIEDDNIETRLQAVIAAHEMGQKGFPIIEKAIEDPEPSVRMQAVIAIVNGDYGDKSFPIFQKAIKDTDPEIVEIVAYEIARFGEKAIPILLEQIIKKETSLFVKKQVILGVVNEEIEMGEKGFSILAKAFEDDNQEIRKLVIKKIARFEKKAIPILLKAIKEDPSLEVRKEVILTTETLKKEGLPILVVSIEDEDDSLRKLTVKIASDIGEEAIPILLKALDDETVYIRKLVIRTATDLGEKAIPIFEKAIYDSEESLRKLTIEKVATLGEKAIPIFIKGMEDSASVRLHTIKVLSDTIKSEIKAAKATAEKEE